MSVNGRNDKWWQKAKGIAWSTVFLFLTNSGLVAYTNLMHKTGCVMVPDHDRSHHYASDRIIDLRQNNLRVISLSSQTNKCHWTIYQIIRIKDPKCWLTGSNNEFLKLWIGTGQRLAAFESRLRVRFAQWSESATVSRPVPSEIDKRGVLYIFIL